MRSSSASRCRKARPTPTSRRTRTRSSSSGSGQPFQVTVRTTPYTTHERLVADLGVYAQDTWTIKRMTVNAGLRWDYLNNKVERAGCAGRHLDRPAALRRAEQRAELQRSVAAARRRLRPVRQRQDGAQGDAQPLRPDVDGRLRAPAESAQHVGQQRDAAVERRDATTATASRKLSELGALTNNAFGQVNIATRYDPETDHGFDNRRNNWEVSTTVSHELMSRVVGGAVVLPPRAGTLHDHRQPRRHADRLPAVLRDGAERLAAAERRRQPDLRALRHRADEVRRRHQQHGHLRRQLAASRPRCSTASTSR